MVGTILTLLHPEEIDLKTQDINIKQVKCTIEGTVFIAIVKMWPIKLLQQLVKLQKYYELIVFTILPEAVVKQIYDQVPELEALISHTLTYDDLVFNVDAGVVYKDLSLLAKNRNFFKKDDSDDIGEIMVTDYLSGEESVDAQNLIYLQGQQYTGQDAYQNLVYLLEVLKQYREGDL